jgi:hypothetical protein
MKRIALSLAAAGFALAGCSAPTAAGTATPSGNGSTHPPAAAPSPAVVDGNILIAPTSYPAGPFRITPAFCGRFSAAQQSQYGTNAAGGLIYRFTNNGSLTGSPEVSVNFLTGSTVTGNNVTGGQMDTGPGQSSTGEVDAVSGGGGNLAFTRCELESYNIVTSAGGAQNGSYAP